MARLEYMIGEYSAVRGCCTGSSARHWGSEKSRGWPWKNANGENHQRVANLQGLGFGHHAICAGVAREVNPTVMKFRLVKRVESSQPTHDGYTE